MRKALAILFLMVYSCSFTEFHQALKVPLLIKHYTEHSSTVDMSFIEFLVMHYETDVPHDDTDMRLPFKTCSHSQATQTAALVQPNIRLNEPVLLSTQDFISFDQQISPSLLSHDIFQPPRV